MNNTPSLHNIRRNPNTIMRAGAVGAVAVLALSVIHMVETAGKDSQAFREEAARRLDQYDPQMYLLRSGTMVTTTPNDIHRSSDVDPDNTVDITDGKTLVINGVFGSTDIPGKVAFSYSHHTDTSKYAAKMANNYEPENLYWVDKSDLVSQAQAFNQPNQKSSIQTFRFNDSFTPIRIDSHNTPLPEGVAVAEVFLGQ